MFPCRKLIPNLGGKFCFVLFSLFFNEIIGKIVSNEASVLQRTCCPPQQQSFHLIQWGPNVIVTNPTSFWFSEDDLTVSCYQKCVPSALALLCFFWFFFVVTWVGVHLTLQGARAAGN